MFPEGYVLMNNLSLKQYKAIDLAMLAVILAVFETITSLAASKWFPLQLFSLSPTITVVCIVMMRWGGWAAIHAVVGGKIEHQLAAVQRVLGIDQLHLQVVRGNALGECMFYGAGAGKRPTASAVVADMIDCAKHRDARMYLNWDAPEPGHFTGPDDLISRWYVRTGASLAAVGGACGNVRLINRESDPPDEYAFLSAPMSGHALRNCSRGMDIRSAFRVLD